MVRAVSSMRAGFAVSILRGVPVRSTRGTGFTKGEPSHLPYQVEEKLAEINEQLRDARDDRQLTKHQERMAECLEVSSAARSCS